MLARSMLPPIRLLYARWAYGAPCFHFPVSCTPYHRPDWQAPSRHARATADLIRWCPFGCPWPLALATPLTGPNLASPLCLCCVLCCAVLCCAPRILVRSQSSRPLRMPAAAAPSHLISSHLPSGSMLGRYSTVLHKYSVYQWRVVPAAHCRFLPSRAALRCAALLCCSSAM